MGGIGKTALAIDLINAEEIRRAFPDRIFWLTVGQSPEPLRIPGQRPPLAPRLQKVEHRIQNLAKIDPAPPPLAALRDVHQRLDRAHSASVMSLG